MRRSGVRAKFDHHNADNVFDHMGSSSGRYLPPAAHPLSAALCGSGLEVYACVLTKKHNYFVTASRRPRDVLNMSL